MESVYIKFHEHTHSERNEVDSGEWEPGLQKYLPYTTEEPEQHKEPVVLGKAGWEATQGIHCQWPKQDGAAAMEVSQGPPQVATNHHAWYIHTQGGKMQALKAGELLAMYSQYVMEF